MPATIQMQHDERHVLPGHDYVRHIQQRPLFDPGKLFELGVFEAI